jgi:hypothetical protein
MAKWTSNTSALMSSKCRLPDLDSPFSAEIMRQHRWQKSFLLLLIHASKTGGDAGVRLAAGLPQPRRQA